MKSVQLTDDEIKTLIRHHGGSAYNDDADFGIIIERLRYLNKRLNDNKSEERTVKIDPPPKPVGWGEQ